MTKTEYEHLLNNLEYLKLKEAQAHLSETIDSVTHYNLTFVQGLIKLTDIEVRYKEANMIKAMVKVAGFPHLKELKDFDFDFQESINKEEILDFTTHRFIHKTRTLS